MRKTASEKHFDEIAREYDFYKSKNYFYYNNLKKLLGSLIPKNRKVFEVGCGTGELLNHLRPKYGYGYDISQKMISISKSKFRISNLTFSTSWPKEKFDYIFMSDVIEHLDDPKETLRKISGLMDRKSVFVCTMANPAWEPVLMIAEKLDLKMPEGPHKRVAFNDLRLTVNDLGMKIIKHDYKLLVPIGIPFITDLANKYFERYFKKLSFMEYFVAIKV